MSHAVSPPVAAMPLALRVLAGVSVLALAGCASTYELTLMPRTSGKLFYGQAVEQSAGGAADVSITIEDKTYNGNWVATTEGRSTGYVSGGIGWGWRRGGIGVGSAPVVIDNAAGGEAKALLQAPDGSGLRCDFKGLGPGRTGGGTCQDDKGLLYDVQIRLKSQ
jgi:hypothetical protein